MKISIIENPRPLSIVHYNDVANAPLSASLNSGYASAISKREGWNSSYLDFSNTSKEISNIVADISKEESDIILFHWVYSWGNEKELIKIISQIKQKSNCLIGAFGLFPTLAYDKLSKYCYDLDFIIVGEFEDTLAQLLHNYKKFSNLDNISGLYSKKYGLKKRNKPLDINTLPIPDDLGSNCLYNSLNISSSRGCFGDCSFCFINSYYGCIGRRERSISSFIKELDYRTNKRKIDKVYFIDPTFIGYGPQKKKRAIEISEHLKQKNLPFGFESRVDTIDSETISTLAANGAESIFLGIESGCNSTLKRMNKRITTDDIKNAVKIIKDSKINLSVGFIMFDPNSTLVDLMQNFNFLEELGLLVFHDQTVNMLYHNQIVLYGSKSWNEFKKTDRLILNPDLPFEAKYKFKDPQVAQVCSSMGKLSTEYFINIDKYWRSTGVTSNEQFDQCHENIPKGLNNEILNNCLKNSFVSFVNNIQKMNNEEYKSLEADQIISIKNCFN